MGEQHIPIALNWPYDLLGPLSLQGWHAWATADGNFRASVPSPHTPLPFALPTAACQLRVPRGGGVST